MCDLITEIDKDTALKGSLIVSFSKKLREIMKISMIER